MTQALPQSSTPWASPNPSRPTGAASTSPWLFSARLDVSLFALPVAIPLLIVALVPSMRSAASTPEWLWVVGVLLVDVAHVWSTAFVTYLNPSELRRHPWRYVGVPVLSWLLGVTVFTAGGHALFWRSLAYLAVYHFVRQQYGWLALYRSRSRDGRWGRRLDTATIYAATLYPLLWWHAHLPRRFDWFVPGDFIGSVPARWVEWGAAAYWALMAVYALRAVWQARTGAAMVPWGKHLLVLGTALTWYCGIVLTNSDRAFTLTNVFAHGVPYAAFVFLYARRKATREAGPSARLVGGNAATAFLRFVACLWLVAYAEELLWNRGLWQEHPALFGASATEGWQEQASWLVPLLAVPQITHYWLDGLLWRRSKNSELSGWLRTLRVTRQARNAR